MGTSRSGQGQRELLSGQVYHMSQMNVLFFSGGVRKLSDLNTAIRNNTKVCLIR